MISVTWDFFCLGWLTRGGFVRNSYIGRKNMNLNTTVTEIENTLQDARGELSVFENKFATGSPEHELIVELLERLDEASEYEVIAENVRDCPDDYDVTEEEVFVEDLVEGDIILSWGDPCEVTRLDGWWLPADETHESDYYQKEVTATPWQREAFTEVVDYGKTITISLRNS